MRKLNLDTLKKGLPGITPNVGKFLSEAALVCFELNNHSSGVQLKVNGAYNEIFEIIWSDKLSPTTINSWKDLKETTEYGATAIALLLLSMLTDYKTFERSRGGSFDFFAKKSPISEENNTVYLEFGKKKEEIPLILELLKKKFKSVN